MTSKNQARPCNECAFRRDITPGHLGGSSPLTYIGQTQGPFMIPCHKLCNFDDPQWRDKVFETGQCAGSAVYRANLGLTGTPPAIHKLPEDKETVFASHAEFLAHHAEVPVAAAQQLLNEFTPEMFLAQEMQRAGVAFAPDTKTQQDVIREALEQGRDPHVAWAAHSLGKPASEVTREERNRAKTQNYVFLYSPSFMKTVRWPRDGGPNHL